MVSFCFSSFFNLIGEEFPDDLHMNGAKHIFATTGYCEKVQKTRPDEY